LLIWIVPAISEQSVRLAKRIPRYTETAKSRLQETLTNLHDEYNVKFLQGWPRNKTQPPPAETVAPSVTVPSAKPLENTAKETSGTDGAPANALAARSNPLTSATTGTPDEEVDAAPLEPVAPTAIPGAPRAPDAAGRPQEPDFTLND